MGEKEIQPLLEQYINDTQNPETNFWLAWEYDKIGQNAAALSYYLRCAELSDDEDLVYECLLKTWLMMNRTGRRPWYEHKQLLTAIAQNPHRPEAYFFLSKIHSEKGEWKDCYYYASTGLKLCDPNPKPLRTDVDYPGDFSLLFQKAYSSWFIGQREQCKRLWVQVSNHPDLHGEWKVNTHKNLKNFGIDINPKKVTDKIDIVLQGQYSDYALETAKYYLNLDFVNNVIISCWMGDNLPSISNSNIIFTQNLLPKTNGTGNRNFQIISSLGGLKLVNTEFAVKMRNDQRYDLNSMENMFDFFHKNKERLTTFEGDETKPKNRILVGGVFEGFPFHPRDHVFWGNTEDLIDVFDMPLEELKMWLK